MSGYTATGKTTNADKISEYFTKENIPHKIIRSDIIRKEIGHAKVNANYFNDNDKDSADKREIVYIEMRNRAVIELAKGNSVILDAGHNKKHMRERIYDLSKELKMPLVLVNTICEDEEEIKIRLAKRNPDNPLEVASSFEVYKYSKGLSDPIKKEALMIIYDTLNNKTVSYNKNKHVKFIEKALKFKRNLK